MWNLLVFALIGLLAGSAARMFYPGRQLMRIVGTLVLGMAGALAAGLFSWIYWPAVDDQFHTGNLLLSFCGAISVIVLWDGVAYVRNRHGSPMTSTAERQSRAMASTLSGTHGE